MAGPTWQDVTSAPEWETLQPAQRAVVQQKFFSDIVTPNIPEGIDPKDAWSQFSQHTADSMTVKRNVGVPESAGRGWLGAASDTDAFARKLVGTGPVLYDAAHSLISGKDVEHEDARQRRRDALAALHRDDWIIESNHRLQHRANEGLHRDSSGGREREP